MFSLSSNPSAALKFLLHLNCHLTTLESDNAFPLSLRTQLHEMGIHLFDFPVDDPHRPDIKKICRRIRKEVETIFRCRLTDEFEEQCGTYVDTALRSGDFHNFTLQIPDAGDKWMGIQRLDDPQTATRRCEVVIFSDPLLFSVDTKIRLPWDKLFENTSIGIAILDLDGRFITLNNSAERILGLSRDSAKAKTYKDVTHPSHLRCGMFSRV